MGVQSVNLSFLGIVEPLVLVALVPVVKDSFACVNASRLRVVSRSVTVAERLVVFACWRPVLRVIVVTDDVPHRKCLRLCVHVLLQLLLPMFLAVRLKLSILLVLEVHATTFSELLVVEVVVRVVARAMPYILHCWLLPSVIATTSHMRLTGLLDALDIELAASFPKNFGVYEGIGESLADRLGVPALTVTVTH